MTWPHISLSEIYGPFSPRACSGGPAVMEKHTEWCLHGRCCCGPVSGLSEPCLLCWLAAPRRPQCGGASVRLFYTKIQLSRWSHFIFSLFLDTMIRHEIDYFSFKFRFLIKIRSKAHWFALSSSSIAWPQMKSKQSQTSPVSVYSYPTHKQACADAV